MIFNIDVSFDIKGVEDELCSVFFNFVFNVIYYIKFGGKIVVDW